MIFIPHIENNDFNQLLYMQLTSPNTKLNIKLRSLKDEDAESIALLANNKNIWDNIRDKMPHPYAKKDADFFINLTKKESPKTTFGIELNNEICGVIGLILQSDVNRMSAEMGYWIGEPFWGRGIATDAVSIITKYGFETLGLMRIYAGVYEYNIGSMRVLEKSGFLKEGIARKSVIKNGNFYDEHKFAKLKNTGEE